MTTGIIDLTSEIQARDGVAVVVYSQPNCQPCRMTRRKLDKAGIYYTEVDVTQDPTALAYIKGLGYAQAPVVYASSFDGDHHWSGLRLDLIERHITNREAA